MQEDKELEQLLSDDEYFAVIQKQYQSTHGRPNEDQADEAWRRIASHLGPAAASKADPAKQATSAKPKASRMTYVWPALIAAAGAAFWLFQRPAGDADQPVARDAGVSHAVALQLAWSPDSPQDTVTISSPNPGFGAFYGVTERTITSISGLEAVAISSAPQTLHLPMTLPAGGRLCVLTASTREGLEKLKINADQLVPQLADAQCLTTGP